MAKSKKKPETKQNPTSSAPTPVVHYNIYGYQDTTDVANDISGSIHSSLLSGYFVFAYRGSGELRRLVVTRIAQDTWMYGMITPGWTCLVPKISREGLLEMCVTEMETRKVPTNIIDDFKYFVSQ
jgi:hypothetical protein